MLPCLFLLQLQRLGIWLTLFLLTIPQGVRAQETWPPISGSVEVRLVGPVYEAELERQEAEEYRVLNEVFKELGETPGSILPEVYLEHAEVRHYRFVIGYKADEEWGTIQDSMISAEGQVSTDRIRILLSSNENREPGLELMARLHKEPNSERRVLEGFRFLLDSNGASTADWFREKVPWSDRSEKPIAGPEIDKAVAADSIVAPWPVQGDPKNAELTLPPCTGRNAGSGFDATLYRIRFMPTGSLKQGTVQVFKILVCEQRTSCEADLSGARFGVG